MASSGLRPSPVPSLGRQEPCSRADTAARRLDLLILGERRRAQSEPQGGQQQATQQNGGRGQDSHALLA
jgi:hypothetical protein